MAGINGIKPLHSDTSPPEGSVAYGISPTGKQLWTLKTERSRSEPKLDENGEQLYVREVNTGRKLVAERRLIPYEKVEIFFMEEDLHGNTYKVEYKPPSAAELAQVQRAGQIAAMKDSLAEALVDKGIDPTRLADLLTAPPTAEDFEVPEPNAGPTKFPHYEGPKQWRLSDGSLFDGYTKAEAKEAEAALHTGQPAY